MLITSSLVLRRFYMINRLISPALLVPYNENRPKSEYVKCHLLGHLMPAIFVGCCVLCDIFLKTSTTPYGSLPFCWIKNERTLLMAFILPSGLLLFLNALVCIVCCLLLLHVRAQNHAAQLSSLGNGWTLFILTKLLFGSGIQWAFGLLAYFYPKDEIIRFPFIVLVSVHGTLILIATLSLKVMRRKIENALHKISQTSIVVIVRGNRSNAVISITTWKYPSLLVWLYKRWNNAYIRSPFDNDVCVKLVFAINWKSHDVKNVNTICCKLSNEFCPTIN